MSAQSNDFSNRSGGQMRLCIGQIYALKSLKFCFILCLFQRRFHLFYVIRYRLSYSHYAITSKG